MLIFINTSFNLFNYYFLQFAKIIAKFAYINKQINISLMKKVIVYPERVVELSVNLSKCRVVESSYCRDFPNFVSRRTIYVKERSELYHSFYFDTSSDFLNYVHFEGASVPFRDLPLSRPRYFGKKGRRLSAYYDL